MCCFGRVLLAGLGGLLPSLGHAEVCRFAGNTSHGGQLAVTATTNEADGAVIVDVTVSFRIAALASDVTYLGEEISTWRGPVLQSAAVNQRTLVDGSVKRQQWDVFRRDGDRLDAYRVQAKRLVDFRQRHPGFVPHWSPSSFGQPWLQDYQGAPPERRPDLDLPAAPRASTPLSFAFYWSRFLPAEGGGAQLVLPGFKRDKQAELRIGAATPGDGWRRWSTPLVHPGLETSPASLAAVWVSPQDYLLQLGFELHSEWASGQALLRAQGCQGVQIRPN